MPGSFKFGELAYLRIADLPFAGESLSWSGCEANAVFAFKTDLSFRTLFNRVFIEFS